MKSNFNIMDIPMARNYAYKMKRYASNYIESYVTELIKTSIGVEINIGSNMEQYEAALAAFFRMMKKYDPKYEKHFSKYSLLPPAMIIPVKTKGVYNTAIIVNTNARTVIKKTELNRITLFFVGKKAWALKHEFDKYMEPPKPEDKKSECVRFYFATPAPDKDDQYGVRLDWKDVAKRSKESLYYSNGETEEVEKHIDRFLYQKKFYEERGLPYKTGIILYGEPGTGKSTMVNAMASKYNREVINLDIPHLEAINLGTLTKAINNTDFAKFIILLEDIDTLFLNREDHASDKEDNSVINKLLQFLDSNDSPNDVIIIATTNHINKLSPALIRDGRFDLKLEVRELTSNEDVINMGKMFELTDEQSYNVIRNYKKKFPNKTTFNQSSLQTLMLEEMTKGDFKKDESDEE